MRQTSENRIQVRDTSWHAQTTSRKFAQANRIVRLAVPLSAREGPSVPMEYVEAYGLPSRQTLTRAASTLSNPATLGSVDTPSTGYRQSSKVFR